MREFSQPEVFVTVLLGSLFLWFLWAIMIKPIALTLLKEYEGKNYYNDSYEVAVWLWKLVGIIVGSYFIGMLVGY